MKKDQNSLKNILSGKKIKVTRYCLWTCQNFNYFGQIDINMVRQTKREALMKPCLILTVKHGGGNIPVWGYISNKGVGDTFQIKE